VQGSSANQATLFEITGGGTAPNPTLDNYDVSLVSGYNIPIKVTPDIPIDTPTWHADTSYNTGADQSVITQKANGQTFLFNDIGDTPGESGLKEPKFPSTRFATVPDGDATWSNSGPTCAIEGCTSDLLRSCPSGLQILGPDNKTVIACDAPANLATASAANLSYYECKNNQGAMDLFSHPAVFQSPNAGSPICFSNQDCQPGTSCLKNPTFTNTPNPAWPAGMGVCNPVIQANGCAANGDACAAFPFVDYSCNTIQTGGGNSLVCLPPTTAGAGELVSNANDWSTTATSCSTTNACTGPQQCFDTTNPVYGNELKACTGASGSCACYSPHSCQSSRGANDNCTQPNSCLDTSGVADGMNDPAIPGTVTCGTNETCYCSPQAIYSGTCGPLNSSLATASTTPLGSTEASKGTSKRPARVPTPTNSTTSRAILRAPTPSPTRSTTR